MDTCDILIVENDFDIRILLSQIFEMEGFTTSTAENGADALNLLKNCCPKLILLDCRMPVMSGEQFLEIKREAQEIANIPVLLMTAASPATLKRLKADVEIIKKPIDLQMLLAKVEEYLVD